MQAIGTAVIAPRLALVCGLYDLACRCGLAADTTASQPPDAAASAAVAVAAPGAQWLTWRQLEGERRRHHQQLHREEQQEGGVGCLSPEAAQAAAGCGLALWRALLRAATADPAYASDSYRMGGPGHKERVRLWQASRVVHSCCHIPASAATLSCTRGLFCAGCGMVGLHPLTDQHSSTHWPTCRPPPKPPPIAARQ